MISSRISVSLSSSRILVSLSSSWTSSLGFILVLRPEKGVLNERDHANTNVSSETDTARLCPRLHTITVPAYIPASTLRETQARISIAPNQQSAIRLAAVLACQKVNRCLSTMPSRMVFRARIGAKALLILEYQYVGKEGRLDSGLAVFASCHGGFDSGGAPHSQQNVVSISKNE